MTTSTNYTTYDLAYYYADLRRITFLTEEEQSRLIEDHLGLAKRIAIDTCPPTAYHKLPDIIGEVNLALVRAGNNYDVRSSEPWPLKNSFASQARSSPAPVPKTACTRSTRCSRSASIR